MPTQIRPSLTPSAPKQPLSYSGNRSAGFTTQSASANVPYHLCHSFNLWAMSSGNSTLYKNKLCSIEPSLFHAEFAGFERSLGMLEEAFMLQIEIFWVRIELLVPLWSRPSTPMPQQKRSTFYTLPICVVLSVWVEQASVTSTQRLIHDDTMIQWESPIHNRN